MYYSVKKQTFKNFEHIIIDGSNNKTIKIIKKIQKKLAMYLRKG